MTCPADLADSLKADEEDRKTDHAPLVQVKENEEVATCDGGMEGDLTETETERNEALSEWEEERQKSSADELKSRSLLRRSSPLSMRRFLCLCDIMDGCAQRRGCGWLAKEQAIARVDVPHSPTAMLSSYR